MNVMNTQSSTENISSYTSESIKRHKRQRFWQIFLPMGLFGLILIAAIVLITIFGLGDAISLRQLSDTAVIWLIVPALLFALITVLVLGGMIYLIAKLKGALPQYTGMVQHYIDMVPVYTRKWSDKAVSPILALESISAKIKTFSSLLFRRSSK